MQIEYLWIALAALLLLAELWAINRVVKSQGKASNKGVWIVAIVFVPLIGLVLWALAGPKQIAHEPQVRH